MPRAIKAAPHLSDGARGYIAALDAMDDAFSEIKTVAEARQAIRNLRSGLIDQATAHLSE